MVGTRKQSSTSSPYCTLTPRYLDFLMTLVIWISCRGQSLSWHSFYFLYEARPENKPGGKISWFWGIIFYAVNWKNLHDLHFPMVDGELFLIFKDFLWISSKTELMKTMMFVTLESLDSQWMWCVRRARACLSYLKEFRLLQTQETKITKVNHEKLKLGFTAQQQLFTDHLPCGSL